MLRVRELPVEEWHRLEGGALGPVKAYLSPSMMRIVVVEDDAGSIVGTWGILTLVHAEGLLVAPEHQHRGIVARLLLREGVRLVRDAGASAFLTSSRSEEMAAYITRMGGQLLPEPTYLVPVDGRFAQLVKE